MRVLLALLALLVVGCSQPAKQRVPVADPHAGHHDHESHPEHHGSAAPPATANVSNGAFLDTSCDAAAQGEFDKGFFFLHNMDYVSARRTFEAAAQAHASCAMLHWGVAMTYFQPLWPGQPTKQSLEKGRAAVARAQAAAGNVGELERGFIDSAAAYYAGDADTATRYKNWEAAQRRVAEQHPTNIEAQAFWSLSRLAIADRKDKTYQEPLAVAAKLEQLLQQRPEHPGLLHYLLHAYDNPMYAKRATAITKTYEAVSPDAAHALHMPSHIHVRLGNWQEVIDWNVKSAAAALERPVDGRVSRDWLHAVDYMIYGYLQQGDDERAKAVHDRVDGATTYELDSGPGAYALASVPARFALERRLWEDAAALPVRRIEYTWDAYPWAEAVTHAARGLGAARSGNVKAARAALAELDKLTPKIESSWWRGRVQIERDVIAGWIAFAKRDSTQAVALLRGAAERELAAGKDNVEPGHVITAAEEYGDLLVALKRYEDALRAYEAALAESPKRFNALFGAGRAAELAGKRDDARRYFRELVDVSAKSSKRAGRAHAQAFLDKH